MKYLILGTSNEANIKVANELSSIHNLKYTNIDELITSKIIYPALKKCYKYTTELDCLNDRFNHVTEWNDLISKYNLPDRTKLARLLLTNADIYANMSNLHEFIACHRADLFDKILYVHKKDQPIIKNATSIPYMKNFMEMLYI